MKIGEVCLLTNDVPRLASFYKRLLEVENDSDDAIHQFILTEGTALDNDIPKTVSIEVSGTLSKLAAFRPEWVQATVDCGGYLEGKVTLPVRISTDSAASGLKIVLLTETVEIELIRIIEES